MMKLTRRELLKSAATVSGAAAVWRYRDGTYLKAQTTPRVVATARVQIGRSGIMVSRVAMGTGFHGWERASNQTRLGQKSFTALMRHGFDNGVNFFDMADLYGSHPFMKNALREIPRDKVVLLSKIWFSGGSIFTPTERARPDVERFLGELGVERLDICLMHCLEDSGWQKHRARMMDEMSELKQKGVIRAVGASCHDLGALKLLAEDPWTDVIFARINPKAESMDVDTPDRVGEVADVLKRARNNGKFVVGMKIFGAGQLVSQEQRDASLRYVWGNGLVDAMTIGFENPAQVKDTVDHLGRVLRA